MPIHRKEPVSCPVEFTINVFAARWKARIVYQLLLTEERSFSELRNSLPGVSDRVLTTQLVELHSDGVISSRRIGRNVLYRLTAAGMELEKLFEAMGEWGTRCMARAALGELAALFSRQSDDSESADPRPSMEL